MISVLSVYEDVSIDNAATVENGDMSFVAFNRISRRAELRLLDWLTGTVIDANPPAIYTSEKVRGWAAPFIINKPYNVSDGLINVEDDFYLYSSMKLLNGVLTQDCETGQVQNSDETDAPIEVLDPLVFDDRVNTYVERLKPSIKHPISKREGMNYEFAPKDLGSISLSYFRYPVFAKIVPKVDPVFNQEVIDENASTNYQWQEFARELLVWFITDTYSLKNRENSLRQLNKDTGKTAKG